MNCKRISSTLWIGIIILLISFGVYFLSACRHNPGYADSDEMITIGYLLGAAHPSGYPLQIWLTKLFTLIPVPGSIAFRANLMNGVLHALAVFFIYFSGNLLIKLFNNKEEHTDDHVSYFEMVVPAIGSLMLAFSGLFWMYAGVAEVNALNDFLAAITIWASLRWYWKLNNNKNRSKSEYGWYVLTWFLAGLGMTHVHTYILLYPGLGIMLLYGLIKYKRFSQYGWLRLILPLFILIISFLIPNLSLFYLNSRQANVSWYFDQDVDGWYGHLTRKVYSGYIPEKNLQVSSYLVKAEISHYFKAFPYYWEFMIEHFSIIGVVFGLFGMSWVWLKRKDLALILSALVFIPGLILALYMGIADKATASLEYRSLIGISQRQYLIGETIWGLAIIVGIWGAINLINKYLKHNYKYYLKVVTVLLGIVFVLVQFIYNFSMGYQANNTHAWDYAQAVLNPLPKDAVLMCFADFSCFSLMYAQEVEGLRTDVKLVSKNIYIKGHWLRKNPDIRGLEDTDNPYFSADVISWNLYNDRRVFMTDSVGYYVSYVGLEGNPFFIIPNGYTFEVVKKVPSQISSFDYPITEKLLTYNRPSKDFWFGGQRDYFSNFHTINSLVFSYLGLKNEALNNLKLALTLTPDYQSAINIYRDLPTYNGNPNYRLGQESSPSTYYLEQGKMLLRDKKYDPAYKTLQKASFLNPKDLETRSLIADLLIMGKYYDAAKMEYKNILRFHPEATDIKQKLNVLPQQ